MYYWCSWLYPNIPNEVGLLFHKEALDKWQNKTVSTESLIELAELVLRNKYFEFNDRFKKQKEGTPYAIVFMTALEEEILESLIKEPLMELNRWYFYGLASRRKWT